MASASGKIKAVDDRSWTWPVVGLLGALIVTWNYVRDDDTAERSQLLLVVGALAVIGWGYWLQQQGRGRDFQLLRDRLLLGLGVMGALAYVNFGHLHFGNFIHTWDTYHYYMGAKYFPEVKYDLLYDCAAIADSEAGLKDQAAARTLTDLRTNVMHKAADVVAHPEVCKSRFTDPARWESFKKDIKFFRDRVNAKRWEEIHQDHGYNATPVWTLAGYLLTNTGPASLEQVTTLNLIDPLYLALMGALLYWAFGARVFALGMLLLGTNFPNRYYWTGGAFLRHDWVFYTVAVVCLLKKEKYFLAGASMAYATLLRLFPGLMIVGPALAGFEYLRVHKKLDPKWVRFVVGGALGCALLLPASLKMGGGFSEGIETWKQFVANTQKHASTPLTNHMGLRTVLGYRPTTVGRHLRDGGAIDPWANWKATKLQKFHDAQPLFFLTLAAMAYLIWLAVKQTLATLPEATLWASAAMGTGYIVAGAELTCYYYCFFVGMAALAQLRREVGLILLTMAGTTLVVAMLGGWLDEQYTTMSIASLAACGAVWWLFTERGQKQAMEAEPWPIVFPQWETAPAAPVPVSVAPAVAVDTAPPALTAASTEPATEPRKKKKKKR